MNDAIPSSAEFFILTTRNLAGTASISHSHPVTGQPVYHPSITGSPMGTISGTFTNIDGGGRVQTFDGLGSFLVTIQPDGVKLSDYQPNEDRRLNVELALSDLDGDGTIFAMEWLFGSDPDARDTPKYLHAQGGMSGADLSVAANPRVFEVGAEFQTFSFRVRKERQNIGLSAETSDSLSFSPPTGGLLAFRTGTVSDGDDFEVITYAIVHQSESLKPVKGFVRLNVDLSLLPAF